MQQINPPLYRITLVQICVTLVLTSAGAGFVEADKAISILLGGLVCCVSNGLYIWLYFYRNSGDRRPEQQTAHSILRTAYRAELSKVVLTVMLFVTVLVSFDELNFLFFFAAYMILQLVFWMAHLLLIRH